jgi:hypothetical protein
MQTHDGFDDIDEELSNEIPCLEEDNESYTDTFINEEYPDNEYATDSEFQNESSEEESNINEGSEENSNINDSEEELNIIDDALDPSKLPNNSGNFSPYFDNITTALLFCWIQKHNICKYTTLI